jgi:hypothetical protein
MADPRPETHPNRAVSQTKRKKKNTKVVPIPHPRTLHRHAEPQVDYFAVFLATCRQSLIRTWQFFLNFDYTLGGILPFTLAEFERAVVYFAILFFSALNGLKIPSRMDLTFQNYTQPSGFSPDVSIFDLNFTGLSWSSRRFSLYGQLFRRDLADMSGAVYWNQTATFSVAVTGIDGIVTDTETLQSQVDLGIPLSRQSRVIRLFDTHRMSFSSYCVSVKIEGNLGGFDTFQISHLSDSAVYVKTIIWYRLVFVAFAVSLLLDPERANGRTVAAVAIIFCHAPTTVWLFFGLNEIAFTADILIGDLFSLFILDFWLVTYSKGEPRPVFAARYLNFVVLMFIVVDSISRGVSEFYDVYGWLFHRSLGFDGAMTVIYLALIVISYFVFLTKKRDPDDVSIDLGTYSCFVAQLCHVLDEFLIRMRVIKCMVTCKHIRLFSEVACLYLMTVGTREGAAEGGPLLSDVQRPLLGPAPQDAEEQVA